MGNLNLRPTIVGSGIMQMDGGVHASCFVPCRNADIRGDSPRGRKVGESILHYLQRWSQITLGTVWSNRGFLFDDVIHFKNNILNLSHSSSMI